MWAYYLLNRGRMEETINFSRAAVAIADKSDRPYLLNTWANAITFTGKPREGLALYRAALKLKSDYWVAHNNVINTLWALGEEENAWRAGADEAEKNYVEDALRRMEETQLRPTN